MKSATKFFVRKKAIPEKLELYGFAKVGSDYVYQTPVLNGDFVLKVLVSGDVSGDNVFTELLDIKNDYDYILHSVVGAEGKFVGAVRAAYEEILSDIRDKCFVPDIFKSVEFKSITEYVAKKYGNEPEFLWDKPPDAAVLRHSNTKKWYAIFMKTNAEKFGLPSSGEIEIIDVKAEPECIASIIDNVKFFPGFHMNKKHWLTVLLNGLTHVSELISLVNTSYNLSTKK